VFGDDLISQTKAALTSVYHYDGLGSTRLLSNLSGAVTDRYTYTAFGETDTAGTSGNNSGSTDNNYLYTGEQRDPNLGFYYLRARYMDPGAGRFVGMDVWMGDDSTPSTLHKYSYVLNMPSQFFDPSGFAPYSADFGNAVHSYVCDEYRGDNPGNNLIDCDAKAPYTWEGDYFKPDIFDRVNRYYGEVKPLSLSGIAKGKTQIVTYDMAYGSQGWRRLDDWWPRPTEIHGSQVYFFNSEGVIFYTDDENERRALASVALAVLASKYRQHVLNGPKKTNTNSPMGGEVVATRVVYAAVGGIGVYAGYQLSSAISLAIGNSIMTRGVF